MIQRKRSYRAIISSDWSECLSPSGPFDCIRFSFPDLTGRLEDVFRAYTGNRITLGQASWRIQSLLPAEISSERMDAYLDAEFSTYAGVPDLIQWCRSHQVLFMINTTAMIGYFQRGFAKKLLPPVPVLSANPLIRYPKAESDPGHILELFEIHDKGRNTAAVAKTLGIRTDKIILVGDSGGDGPHFEWGAKVGATLVGSMTKASLESYCSKKGITIHHRIGRSSDCGQGSAGREAASNFLDLAEVIKDILAA